MGIIKQILFTIYKSAFIFLGMIIPKNRKLVIFESFLGKQYSDNPRAIYEYLKENKPDFKMYWSADSKSIDNFYNYDVQYIKRFSIRWLFLMNRAKYWVSNSRLPLWIPKPKNTIYIQTWHGTPLKKLALDMDEVHMPGTNTGMYKQNFIRETKKWDYLISPNAYSTEIFKRAFQFEKDIIESGYPRNDYLINNNTAYEMERIKKQLDIPQDKKVILYAPTWRDDQFYEIGRYKFEINMDLELMKKELSGNYVILFRMHYLIAENLDLSHYKGFIHDVSNHEDIRELYIISDILITDYSSVFFDYSILNRPIIFYVYDIDEYRDKLRGFYFDFENEAPGPFVKQTTQLINEILQSSQHPERSEKMRKFRERFCYLEDGRASERVVNAILSRK